MKKVKVRMFSIWLFLGMFVLMGYVEPSYSLTPTVTSVTPNTGTTGSTQDVTITGTNFEPGAKVSLLNGGPFLAGDYDTTPGIAKGVFVSGNYAFVAVSDFVVQGYW
ncbi:MAG: IPT/TIG domain-containing protein [Nitrospinota bacterium]